MLVFLYLLDDITWHQYVEHLRNVVSCEAYPAVEVAIPILGELIISLMHLIKCSMSSWHVYFTPKLSMTRVKEMGRVACFQRPGVC
jgi:hypothetical protein